MSGTIDISQLPPPNVVEPLHYDQLFDERKARLIALYPEDQQAAMRDVLSRESEPLVKLLQENAYRELILRQRINEAASANMLAFAQGQDLDHLAANFNVKRLTVAGQEQESDTDLRLRTQRAFEGLSVAGPRGAYEYHALSADGRIADATADSPAPCDVLVTVMSRHGNGAADEPLLDVVRHALNDETVRPVGDRVTVQSAHIVDYAINATLYVNPGPEQELILEAARSAVARYVNEQRRLGRSIRRNKIIGALDVSGVQDVQLHVPEQSLVLDRTQASYCTAIDIQLGGQHG